MLLADTSIWVDHLRRGNTALIQCLEDNRIVIHPHIIGELALGSMRQRGVVLSLLQHLPQSPVASDREVCLLIERRRLFGRGIGYVDAHLLASVLLSGEARLWTRDRALGAVADELKLGVKEPTRG